MDRKRGRPTRTAVVEVARALVHELYGPTEQPTRITIRTKSGIRIRVDVPELQAITLPPEKRSRRSPVPEGPFVPTPFQKGILSALAGQALRTDDLARKVGNRRKLFIHPRGLRELRDHSLVAHHDRLGYYRPDALPPALEAPSPD